MRRARASKKNKMVKEKQNIINYLSLGWEFALPIVLGVVIGYYLDQLLNTKYIFRLTFLIGGIAGSYINLFRIVKRMEKNNSKKQSK